MAFGQLLHRVHTAICLCNDVLPRIVLPARESLMPPQAEEAHILYEHAPPERSNQATKRRAAGKKVQGRNGLHNVAANRNELNQQAGRRTHNNPKLKHSATPCFECGTQGGFCQSFTVAKAQIPDQFLACMPIWDPMYQQ